MTEGNAFSSETGDSCSPRRPKARQFLSVKANRPIRSPMAGRFNGTYGLPESVCGLERLSRLRFETLGKLQFSSMKERGVVGVCVTNIALLREAGYDDERNARAVAEEVDGLDIARVIVAAAFVECDEDCRRVPSLRRLHALYQLVHFADDDDDVLDRRPGRIRASRREHGRGQRGCCETKGREKRVALHSCPILEWFRAGVRQRAH